ncbi:MAG: hypothetical protein CTY15_04490 [Methylocystis sp.]|nr:MAG: hypothetical protein CTY15_04490 [Methylocystis sp.]
MDDVLFARGGAGCVDLPSGARVQLPLRYLDWTGMMAHFPASAAAIRKLLPSPKLKPVLAWPGTAILSVAALEYRRLADVRPYNEVAIMTPVLYEPALNIPAAPLLFPKLFKGFGLFVLHMPVTTQESLELGVQVWGYPKFLADIRFEEEGNLRRCRVRADGKDVLTLGVKQAPGQIRNVDFRMLTVKDGKLLPHLIETEGLYGLWGFPGGASLSFGDHPVGRELQSLGVGKTALARVFASNVRSLLHEAVTELAI